MRMNDAVSGGALMAAAVVIVGYAQSFPARPGIAFGPGLFPTIIGCGLFIGGVLLAVQSWQAGEGSHGLPDWARSPQALGGLALLFGLIAFYVLLADQLGFLVTAFVILSAFQVWFGVRVLPALGLAALGALALYLSFSRLLAVPLPVVWLETYLW